MEFSREKKRFSVIKFFCVGLGMKPILQFFLVCKLLLCGGIDDFVNLLVIVDVLRHLPHLKETSQKCDNLFFHHPSLINETQMHTRKYTV